MRRARFALLAPLLLTSTVFAGAHAAADAPDGPTADQAYRQLIDGHARYATDTRTLPRQDERRRCDTTTNGQHPVAAVLTCADSRVPPEMLFDQGLGDLFVVRVAGNVAATDELGTLEYGIEHLHIPLIVVLGHSRCGAVTAVVDGAHAEGNLAQLLKPIVPAADRARQDHPTFRGPTLVSAAIQENVRQAMHDLTTRSPVLAKAVMANRVKIVGGVYDIHSGRVDWLSDSSLAGAEPSTTHESAAAHEPAAAPAHDVHAADVQTTDVHTTNVHAADLHATDAHTTRVDLRPVDTHAEPADAHAVTPHAPAAPAPHAADPHAAVTPAAVGHAAPAHAPPAPAALAKTKTPAAPQATQATLQATLTAHWPILAGLVVASTLIGAGLTHVAGRGKA